MSSSDALLSMYDDYYGDAVVAQKRAIAARQTFGHIEAITRGETFNSVLDIGAGEGAVLSQLSAHGFGKVLNAVEISGSGIEAIKHRNIPNLAKVDKFDGYHIPHPDRSIDLGLAVHVVEHVEHERMFLNEAKRVCKKLYVEVPLEHTRNLRRAIHLSGPYGHINFYTPLSFENLLKTSGLKVERMMVFPHDLAYEQLLAGKTRGWLKYQARRGLLKLNEPLAVRNLVYMAGALCTSE